MSISCFTIPYTDSFLKQISKKSAQELYDSYERILLDEVDEKG